MRWHFTNSLYIFIRQLSESLHVSMFLLSVCLSIYLSELAFFYSDFSFLRCLAMRASWPLRCQAVGCVNVCACLCWGNSFGLWASTNKTKSKLIMLGTHTHTRSLSPSQIWGPYFIAYCVWVCLRVRVRTGEKFYVYSSHKNNKQSAKRKQQRNNVEKKMKGKYLLIAIFRSNLCIKLIEQQNYCTHTPPRGE